MMKELIVDNDKMVKCMEKVHPFGKMGENTWESIEKIKEMGMTFTDGLTVKNRDMDKKHGLL